jgi:uncharacterized lipoprotein YmbA
LPGARVSVYPQDSDPGATYRVRIEIQRFDGTPGEAATVEALWSVSPPKGGSPLTGHALVRDPCGGPSDDALTAAYSKALDTLSHDIAVAIRTSLSH